MKYRREIDGLRAVAVLPVILFHAGFKLFGGGYVGVDVFFVISGYLITSIILAQKEAGTFTLAGFYERRARRILPVLFLVVFACLPFAWKWMFPIDLKLFAKSLVAVCVFGSNILFWMESGYFQQSADLKPLLHTWSLAVEEQYYLLFPLFMLLAWRLGRRWIVSVLAVVAAVSFALAQWGRFRDAETSFYLLPTRGWEILVGAFLAFYLFGERGGERIPRWVRELGSVMGLALIAYAVFAFDKNTPFPGVYTLIPSLGAAAIVLFTNPQTVVGRMLGSRVLVGIGLISYSLYLWHQPLFAFARLRSVDEPSAGLLFALIGLAIALALASWKFVEGPFRDRKRVSLGTLVRFAVVCVAILIPGGVFGYLDNGFEKRFSPEVIRLMTAHEPACQLTIAAVKDGKACLIGDAKAVPAMALVGDSHSAHLMDALSESLAQKGESALVVWHPGCVPLLDVGTDDVRKSPECRAFIDTAFDFVMKRPALRTVVLAAEWSSYTKGYRWNDSGVAFYSDRSSSGTRSVAENVAVFARGLERTRGLLASGGRQIVFVKSVPEYEVLLPKYFARQVLLGVRPELPVRQRITRAVYEERNREVDGVLRDLQVYSWARVVDSFGVLCGSGSCQYEGSDGGLFYTDGNHLSVAGARIVVGELMGVVGEDRVAGGAALNAAWQRMALPHK